MNLRRSPGYVTVRFVVLVRKNLAGRRRCEGEGRPVADQGIRKQPRDDRRPASPDGRRKLFVRHGRIEPRSDGAIRPASFSRASQRRSVLPVAENTSGGSGSSWRIFGSIMIVFWFQKRIMSDFGRL